MHFNVNLYNIIVVGVAFFFLFTAFQTASLTSPNVLEDASKQSNGTFSGVGYVSLAIVYVTFAFCNWLAPAIVLCLGQKYTMFLGASCYVLFIASFIQPLEITLYLTSFLNGFGAAVLWTAQSTFITECSTVANVNKHFTLFWGIFQANQIVGGLYVYLSLSNTHEISKSLRIQLYSGLLGCAILGTLLFILLKKPNKTEQLCTNPIDVEIVIDEDNDPQTYSTENVQLPESSVSCLIRCSRTFRRCFELLFTIQMFAISIVSIFTGLSLTVYSSVYATSLGHYSRFGQNAKSYIGLAGLFIGCGEILGSFLAQLSRCINLDGVVVIVGYTSSMIASFFFFLMLPPTSPIMETTDMSYIYPNLYLVLFVAILFGISDSVWNTQISALIGLIYKKRESDIPVAFALYKCIQSIASAVSFAYSTQLVLHWQVSIYVLFATGATYAFFYAFWTHLRALANIK